MGASKKLFEEQHNTEKPMETTESTQELIIVPGLWQSQKQSNLLPALLKFHQKDLKIAKDRTVPVNRDGSVTRSYTTLDEIISKVKPALAAEGLMIHQHFTGTDVITVLQHVSGEFIASKVGFTPMQGSNTNALQNAGGGLTYLRRYCMACLLNLNFDTDTDAEGEAGNVKEFLGSEKLAQVKKWIQDGQGTLEQVKAKYQLSTLQESFLRSKD